MPVPRYRTLMNAFIQLCECGHSVSYSITEYSSIFKNTHYNLYPLKGVITHKYTHTHPHVRQITAPSACDVIPCQFTVQSISQLPPLRTNAYTLVYTYLRMYDCVCVCVLFFCYCAAFWQSVCSHIHTYKCVCTHAYKETTTSRAEQEEKETNPLALALSSRNTPRTPLARPLVFAAPMRCYFVYILH